MRVTSMTIVVESDVFDLGKGDDVIYLGGDTDIVKFNDGDDKLITKSGQGHVSADGGRGMMFLSINPI